MSRAALLSSTAEDTASETWTCGECAYVNKVRPQNRDDFADSDDEGNAVPDVNVECALCRFFDCLLMLSGRVLTEADRNKTAALRAKGDEFVRAADIVLAFKLWQFHTNVKDRHFREEIAAEQRTLNTFKQLFAKVVLLAHDKYRRIVDSSGLWSVRTARRKFTRASLAKLWMTLTSPDLRVDNSTAGAIIGGFNSAITGVAAVVDKLDLGIKTSTAAETEDTVTSFRALTQLGALECVQLTDMFFGRDPGKLVDDISMKVMYFDTLFMNIEVNTFGGQVNGQIDANEFWEGLNLLGIPPEVLDVPMVHFHAFVQAYRVNELNKPLFRILCLQLSSPSASTNDANIVDMVGGAIRPRKRGVGSPIDASDLRLRASDINAHVAHLPSPDQPVPLRSVFSDDGTEDGGHGESKAHSVLSGPSMTTDADTYAPSEADFKPARRQKSSWRVTNNRLDDVRHSTLSLHFVVEFRKRLQFLYSSAEGSARAINWNSFWLTFITTFFLPIGFAMYLHERTVSSGFNLYYVLFWAVSCAYWAAIMVPLNAYLATTGVECVTMFEALYPAFTFFLASLAVACYRGYYGVVLHPSTFKFLRLKYRLEGLKVIFHYFETGQNVAEPVIDMLQREGIIPSLHSHEDLMTSQQSFMTAFSKRQRQVINILSVLCALFVSLLPGVIRASPNSLYRTGVCHSFFADEGDATGAMAAASVCYVIIGFIHTLLCELFLVRLYVAYARISRYFTKFTALMDPMEARKKRVNSLISFANEEKSGLQSGGRLSGFTNMSVPGNVAAWSKVRVFMLAKFADDLGKSELFLAFFVVFGVALALVSVLFVVTPASVLDDIDGSDANYLAWQWKVMATLCGIVAAIIMVPVFLVLLYGVQVNSTLSSHHSKLLKLKYTLAESVARARHFEHAAGAGISLQDAQAVTKAESARMLVQDLVHIIEYNDTKITILGIAITDTLVRTVFSSIGVAALSSLAKVMSTDLKSERSR